MRKRSKEHQMERRVRLLKEAFRTDVERLMRYLKTDEGRMAFQVALTPQEELQRWQNPLMKAQTMQAIMQKDGLEATAKWIRQMQKMEETNE